MLKSYIDAKKQKNEQKLLEEKQMKIEFEKQRREKLKQLSEHTKTAVQQSIPVAPVGQKRRAPAEVGEFRFNRWKQIFFSEIVFSLRMSIKAKRNENECWIFSDQVKSLNHRVNVT